MGSRHWNPRPSGSEGGGLRNKEPLAKFLQEQLKDPDKLRREYSASLKKELVEVGTLLTMFMVAMPVVIWFTIYELAKK